MLPTWHHEPVRVQTFGPEVYDACGLANFEPYPEQALALDAIFAVRADGKVASAEVDVVAARQALKTGLAVQAMIGWIAVTQQQLVVYSAHQGFAVEEAFRTTKGVIQSSPLLSKRLMSGRTQGIKTGKGDESIEFRGGQRILFKPRTPGNGRSLTANRIIVDEKWAYTAAQSGDLAPTLRSVTDPQILGLSSAGKSESVQLRDARNRGRGATGARHTYLEWGDPDPWSGCRDGDACDHAKTRVGCALDDEDRWQRIIPGLDSEEKLETIRLLRSTMDPAEFARELMVWWDESADSDSVLFDVAQWVRLFDPESQVTRQVRFALDVAPDQSTAAIVAAGLRPDGMGHVEITSRDGVLDHRPGLTWVVPRLKRMAKRWGRGFAVAVVAGSPAAVLRQSILNAGVEVIDVPAVDVPAAHGLLFAKVSAEDLRHLGQPTMGDAIAGVRKYRENGETAWKFGRARSTADITPACAAAVALLCVERNLTAEYDVGDSLY